MKTSFFTALIEAETEKDAENPLIHLEKTMI
jgi:hypothetical protein